MSILMHYYTFTASAFCNLVFDSEGKAHSSYLEAGNYASPCELNESTYSFLQCTVRIELTTTPRFSAYIVAIM